MGVLNIPVLTALAKITDWVAPKMSNFGFDLRRVFALVNLPLLLRRVAMRISIGHVHPVVKEHREQVPNTVWCLSNRV